MIYCFQHAQFYLRDKISAERRTYGDDHWLYVLSDDNTVAEWLFGGATASEIDAIVAAINAISTRISRQTTESSLHTEAE